jgi:hypothetical protein
MSRTLNPVSTRGAAAIAALIFTKNANKMIKNKDQNIGDYFYRSNKGAQLSSFMLILRATREVDRKI